MTNELMVANQNQNQTYCSLEPKTQSEKIALFNALEKCDFRLNDKVGEVIKLKDVFVQEFESTNKETGEPMKKRRTILFDENNKTYVTGSSYLYFALMKMLNVFGEPSSWGAPLTVKVVKKEVQNNRLALTLELIDEVDA